MQGASSPAPPSSTCKISTARASLPLCCSSGCLLAASPSAVLVSVLSLSSMLGREGSGEKMAVCRQLAKPEMMCAHGDPRAAHRQRGDQACGLMLFEWW